MADVNEKTIIWNWRKAFTGSNLKQGESDALRGKITHFSADPGGKWAKGVTAESNFSVEVKKAPTNLNELADYPSWLQLHGGYTNRGDTNYFKNYYSCECAQGQLGARCRHLAALMFHWESVHGPFVMNETEEERAERLRRLEEERLKKERLELEAKQKKELHSISEVLTDKHSHPTGLTFNPNEIIKGSNYYTSLYDINRKEALSEKVSSFKLSIRYDSNGKQVLYGEGKIGGASCSMTLSSEQIQDYHCSCGRANKPYYRYYSFNAREFTLCEHLLVLFEQMRNQIYLENPGDLTDRTADKLLALLSGNTAQIMSMEDADRRPQGRMALTPRIIRDKNKDLTLGFDIGQKGARSYALKGLEKFVNAVESNSEFQVTKNFTINFAEDTLDDDSEKWYRMIVSRIRSVKQVNEKLNRGSSSYYYYSSQNASFR